MTFSESFLTQTFPLVLADNPEFTKGTNYKLKIVINEVGGWMVDFNTVPAAVYQTTEWGDAQLEISDGDFEALVQDPNKAPSYYFSGKARLKGKTILFADFHRWLLLKRKTT